MNRACNIKLLFLLISLGTAYGEPETSAKEIVGQSVLFAKTSHFQLTCLLTVTDATGDKKVRELTITSLQYRGEQRFLAQVTAPTFLRNLKFLRVETQSGTGTWLKTSRGTQRMASDGDPEPLFGSDFSTADFQPGTQDWVISAQQEVGMITVERPSEPRWGWVQQKMTLRNRDQLVVKSEFFDSQARLVRRYQVMEFEENGLPRRIVLEDLKNSRRSELVVLTFDPEKPVPVTLFTPGSL